MRRLHYGHQELIGATVNSCTSEQTCHSVYEGMVGELPFVGNHPGG